MKLAKQKATLQLWPDNRVFLFFEPNEEGNLIRAHLPDYNEIRWSDKKNRKRGDGYSLIEHLKNHSITIAEVTVSSGYMHHAPTCAPSKEFLLDKIKFTFD